MKIEFKILGKILGILTDHSFVKKAVLFGSRARGTSKAKSDVDIAVYLNEGFGDSETLLELIKDDISESTLIINVDLVAVNDRLNPLLKKEIEETGLPLYERREVVEGETVFQKMLMEYEILLKELKDILDSDTEQDDSNLPTRLKMWRQATLSLASQCFERAWKTIRRYAIDEGYGREINGSKDAIRAGNALGLIADPELWFEAVVKRNKLIHEYELVIANETLKFILDVQLTLFEDLLNAFENTDVIQGK